LADYPRGGLCLSESVAICETNVRSKTVKILNNKQIQFSSVDLARFSWNEATEDGRGKVVFSRVTIWIGVVPDSTNADAAYASCQPILKLLAIYGIDDIDVAYRESEARLLTGPPLYAPVSNLNNLKNVIDWATTALSVPIAGVKTLNMQGTLGFYFKVGNTLYGVTARHVLFPGSQGNLVYNYPGTFISPARDERDSEYSYTASPRRDVAVMGNKAFDDFLATIMANIGTMRGTLKVLNKRVATLEKQVQKGKSRRYTSWRKPQPTWPRKKRRSRRLEPSMPR
jgi:hypothetical protein